MKTWRNTVPFLGLLALLALYFKLPESPNIFTCKACSSSDPYLPLIGSGYFAALIAFSLLFPKLPGPKLARVGLTWAVLLAIALTYFGLPDLCPLCLIGHVCNILIWLIWLVVPAPKTDAPSSPLKQRLCILFLTPIAVIALFSSLNLSFMIYGVKINRHVAKAGLMPGAAAPNFSAETNMGKSISNADAAQYAALVLNFVTPECPYCREQEPIVNDVANKLSNGSYRFINISPSLPKEWIEQSPATEWVQDKDGKLRELFKVSAYPTLFVIGRDGKIEKVIHGVTDQLKTELTDLLLKQK